MPHHISGISDLTYAIAAVDLQLRDEQKCRAAACSVTSPTMRDRAGAIWSGRSRAPQKTAPTSPRDRCTGAMIASPKFGVFLACSQSTATSNCVAHHARNWPSL